MTKQMQPNQLTQFQLFSTLSGDECSVIAPLFTEVSYAAGTPFIEQDGVSTQLFLIISGIAEVRLPLIGPRGTTSVAKFGPGECVGELSLAKVARRAASAVAEVDCKMFAADTEKLIEIFDAHPKIGYQVYRKLAAIITDRLVATNMMLRNSASR